MLRQTGLYAAWLIALVATLGSLYFSEVRLFIPCTYCWYQRILMYPLVILLGIASYRQDNNISIYTLPLSILGVLIAGYHYLGQKIPDLISAGGCSSGVPCSHAYINWAGFITIPFLALTAFVLITICLAIVAFSKEKVTT